EFRRVLFRLCAISRYPAPRHSRHIHWVWYAPHSHSQSATSATPSFPARGGHPHKASGIAHDASREKHASWRESVRIPCCMRDPWSPHGSRNLHECFEQCKRVKSTEINPQIRNGAL